MFGCFLAGRGLVPCRAHTRPSGRRLLRCGDCGAWTCSWRLVRRRVWLFAVVVSCFVPCCVLACGAACVPCLACVWRALLSRACCCAGAGTHSLSGGPVWLHGGPYWRPVVPRRAAVGCVYVGRGGGWVPLPSPSAPCPSVPFRRPALPAYPLPIRWVGLGWSVGLGGLTWCFFPAGRRGLGTFLGRVARVVCRAVCTVSWASWLLFTGVHALCVMLRVRCPGPLGSCSTVCALCVWCCAYCVLGLLAPVHRRARPVCRVACKLSWASWLLFTGVRALCVVLCARCPGSLASCSAVCAFCVWCGVYGVLGLLAPVHRCARSVCGVVCTVSWASWLLFTGVHALCVVLRVRCPGPPGFCSPASRSVCGVVGAVSWAAWLLFTSMHALWTVLCAPCPGPLGSCAPVCLLRCAVSCVRCPGPLGSGSPVCTLCVRCRVRGLLSLLALFCWCARVVCVVLRVWCPGTLGSCSPVLRCAAVYVVFGVRCCLCGVLGLPAPVHRCACPVCGVAWAVSWAAWLLFTGVLVRSVVPCVWCPEPLGSQSPVCLSCVLRGVCGAPGHVAPVHRCARVACVVLRVWCPGPRGSCSPACCVLVRCVVCSARCPRPRGSCSSVYLLGVLRGVCGVGVGVCLRVPYRPRCIFRRAGE